MGEVSRALANRHYDRAFVLLREIAGAKVAAVCLLEFGVPGGELPRDAVGALREAIAAERGAAE